MEVGSIWLAPQNMSAAILPPGPLTGDKHDDEEGGGFQQHPAQHAAEALEGRQHGEHAQQAQRAEGPQAGRAHGGGALEADRHGAQHRHSQVDHVEGGLEVAAPQGRDLDGRLPHKHPRQHRVAGDQAAARVGRDWGCFSARSIVIFNACIAVRAA